MTTERHRWESEGLAKSAKLASPLFDLSRLLSVSLCGHLWINLFSARFRLCNPRRSLRPLDAGPCISLNRASRPMRGTSRFVSDHAEFPESVRGSGGPTLWGESRRVALRRVSTGHSSVPSPSANLAGVRGDQDHARPSRYRPAFSVPCDRAPQRSDSRREHSLCKEPKPDQSLDGVRGVRDGGMRTEPSPAVRRRTLHRRGRLLAVSSRSRP
jgi:hypothetical protein